MKRVYLLLLMVGLFSIALPLRGVSARVLSDDPVRVISLLPVGDEKAFTVAFLKDGNQLIVGASAGIVLFNTKKPAKLLYTPHDCRVCHHPATSTKPPAIVEVRCELASAFQPAGAAPTPPVWKPGPAEQFWSTLEVLGINMAQLVTFVT